MDTANTRHLPNVDYEAFEKEILQVRKDALSSLSYKDYLHLKKYIWTNRIMTFLGYATAWIFPNPISAFLIGYGIYGRWMVMHHVAHGGWDNVPGTPPRYNSKRFAVGWRRYIDWFDWMWPPAWHVEHNQLHHYCTGEDQDPDLVEDHVQVFKNFPVWVRYLFVFITLVAWKITYYAPNTLRAMEYKGIKSGRGPYYLLWDSAFNLAKPRVWRLWLTCYIPYATVSFVVIPLLFLPLGETAVWFVLINRLLAEVITNAHGIITIGTNHTGADLYRFNYHFKNKGEYYVNQIVGSCNFNCGTEFKDYMHGWLNYQIEHHLFPNLPFLKYREIQPRVKEICQRHGVPYVQESVVTRFGKMVDIMVGKTKMHWLKDEQPKVNTISPQSEELSEPKALVQNG